MFKKWEWRFALFLIGTSGVLYYVLFKHFGNGTSVYESFISQVAFLPISVLIVTLVIEQLLNRKEKEAIALKLNVVIGLFFHEIGRELIKSLLDCDKKFSTIKHEFIFNNSNFEHKHKDCLKLIKSYNPEYELGRTCILDIKQFLSDKKSILEQLIQNPNLFEHDSFTEMLLALFHLYQELYIREDLNNLSDEDFAHIKVDIRRVHIGLIKEWLIYMDHLKSEYPYIFSIELRANPFQMDI